MNLRSLLLGAVSLLGLSKPDGEFIARAKFRDAINPSAFPFRMGAGSPGTVTRTHPVSISAYINDPTHPLTAYGQAVLFNPAANDVRCVLTTDSGILDIDGVTVRPYPYAGVPTASIGAPSAFGGESPAPSLPVDVVRLGSILVQVSGPTDNIALGAAVFLWIAAASGAHIVGGFEGQVSTGNTIALPARWKWGGPPDANGVAELLFNAAS